MRKAPHGAPHSHDLIYSSEQLGKVCPGDKGSEEQCDFPQVRQQKDQGVGSTPNRPAVGRVLSPGTVAPWTWLAALPPAFGQLTPRLGPEPLSFPTWPLSIADQGALRNFPQGKACPYSSLRRQSPTVLPSETRSDLSFPLAPPPLLPTHSQPGPFKTQIGLCYPSAQHPLRARYGFRAHSVKSISSLQPTIEYLIWLYLDDRAQSDSQPRGHVPRTLGPLH